MSAAITTPTLESVEFDPFAGVPVERVIATSEAQREVWLADKLGTDASLAFNESVNLRLRGRLDLEALQSALHAVVARHESLRSTVGPDGTELLIGAESIIDLPVFDLRDALAAEQAAVLARAAVQAVEIAFDVERGPLFRAALYRLSDVDHVLLMTAHHIVCDGWSWAVITDDLGALYAECLGIAPGLDAPASYGDYVAWELAEAVGPAMREHETFWLGRFAGNSLPVLDLPTDRPRAPVRSFRSRRLDHLLDAPLVADVRKLGAKLGVSVFGTLFSGFAATLHRLTGQDDLVIGVPAAGQSASGMTALVGHCVNLLPIRATVDAGQAFDAFVTQSGSVLLDAFDHQTLTYGTLLKKLPVQRDPSRLPLVSVMFNVDQSVSSGSEAFPGLTVELSANPRHFENFELFVNAAPVDGGFRLECQYNTDLFDALTIERWLAAYEALLRSAVRQPTQPLGQLGWLGAAELDALGALQPAATPLVAGDLMHSAFVRQSAAMPQRTALSLGDQHLSYLELDRRSNRLARALRARGVGRGERVGLCVTRGIDMVVSLLGVLKAGATYVPLDPSFPQARLAYYAEDAALALLVTESTLAIAPTAWRADAAQRALQLDRDTAWLSESAEPLAPSAQDAQPEDPAYIIYTSGSTGKPKGVCVPHRSVANFLASMRTAPGIVADDRLAAVTTLSFDIAVLELMLPLTVGAQVVVVPRETAMDGNLLRALLVASEATMMQATPGMWRMLLDTDWQGGQGFKALVGGESCPPDLATALLGRAGELWNMYGPTETTVWSTVWRVDRGQLAQRGMSIGRPIANTSVWIVDENLQACPIGVPGEICIGGAGVALGYLDRPDLSADRFKPDPFSAASGALLYRTGDRGRWRNDGLLEHMGRLDFQVKVRGYRIELGEIEAGCNEVAGVAHSVVMAREDQPGDVRLVAYLTLAAGAVFDDDVLRSHLRGRLPDYMLPQHVVVLDAMPLLPNGKVDRKALPAPESQVSRKERPRRAPRTDIERLVLEAMETLLKLPGLGIDDNFFSLGGHSLMAAKLATRLTTATGIGVSLRTVFDAPTPEQLAAAINRGAGQQHLDAPSVEARLDQSRAPASLMQQRIWFLEQFEPGRRTYNTPSAHRLKGALDVNALELAFNEMVRRQAILRTELDEEDGIPYQRVLAELKVSLTPLEDLSDLPSDTREASLAKILEARVMDLIDLRHAPLFRVALFKLTADEHVLYFMPHHIIWDGWSFDLFYEEMAQLYASMSQGLQPELEPLEKSYGDFAQWQQRWLKGDDVARQVEHWKDRLNDLPAPLDLPADRPRPLKMTGNGHTLALSRENAQIEPLRRLAKSVDATLFMTLLAGYAALLSRLTGQTDIVIGTPVRGRPAAELEKIMGFFVNALPLRVRVDPRASFATLVAQVREVVLEGFAYPDVPFERLIQALNVPRDEVRSPIYQAFFSFQDARDRVRRWGNLTQEQLHLFQPGTADDIGLWFLQHPTGLAGGLTFNTDILSAESAHRFAERYFRLLDSAAASPDTPVAHLDVMARPELEALEKWNATLDDLDPSPNVAELFELQCQRTPDAVALQSGGVAWTYRQLAGQANRLARELRARGAGRGQLIGLCVSRNARMLIAQLAILKSGAAYVPLDPRFPVDRLAYMVEDAELSLLVIESSLVGLIDWDAGRSVHVDALALDAHDDSPLDPAPEHDALAEDPAYVIYTSGSTGRPKGVKVPHRAVVNFLLSMARQPGLRQDDRMVAVTTLSFDIAVLELLLPLVVGAQVVLADAEQVADGVALRALVECSNATAMQATPSTWHLLIEAGWQGSPTFKALIGGESLPVGLAQQLLERVGELWNMYGPTETTVWSTMWKVEHPEEGIFIGRPIANTTIHVLDESMQPSPIGAPGEIYIGGSGVALGYLKRPELTQQRFVDDPFCPGQRLYRTGDRGRWRYSGTLEHLGRLDFQVKVRGYRIELGEIESNLAEHPGVRRALVIVREDQPGDSRLVAYVVPQVARPSTGELREHLRKTLPDYMLPQHVVCLTAIPLLPNGKVDRQALPSPSDALPVSAEPEGVLTPDEQAVIQIWQSLLGVERVRVTDNFFEIGGHSMLALRLIARLEKHFGRRLPVSMLMEAPSVRSLVARLGSTEANETLVTIRVGDGKAAPLFMFHDGDGETLLYRSLALALKSNRTVYGVQPHSVNGHPFLRTRIPEMAAQYVEQIRRVQPRGPYLLGGLCAGGVIAFEAARQLETAGERVAMLALIDVADVAAPYRSGLVASRRLSSFTGGFKESGSSALERLAKGAALGSSKLVNLILYEGKARLRALATTNQIKKLEEHLDAGTMPPDTLRRLTVRDVYIYARGQYAVDGRVDANVVLFRATQGRGDLADEPVATMYTDPLLGWEQRVAAGRLVAIDLPGGHSSVLQEPNVQFLAEELEGFIDQSMVAGSTQR